RPALRQPMQPAERVGHATPVRLRLRRSALHVCHHHQTVREQPAVRRRDRHRHGQTFTVEVFEELGLPREISVAPGTETTDREVPVDAHAPHVVGDPASEWFDASYVFTPLPECLPSHWRHLRGVSEHRRADGGSIELTGRRRACLRTTSPHNPSGTAPMPKLYEALAEAFRAEGVDTQFVLMGDGNMHWSTTFAKLPGVHTVHVRHEHATVAAATAYNVATGKVAVASVTCGPGVTQLMTALPAAVRARLPMVVFAGESPINAKFYNQAIDQAPLVTATGARYIAAHS